MNKIYICANGYTQARLYAQYLGLRRQEYVYLVNAFQLQATRNALVIELRSAVLCDNYLAIQDIMKVNQCVKVNVGW